MLPVVLCGNNAYSDQFQVFAHSFRKHNPDRRVVMFHSGDFNEALLARYGVESQIVHRLQGSSDRFNATHMHGALLRLVAFDWIRHNWNTNIIYMDLDILVCGSVDEADTIELSKDAPIAGVDEYHALCSRNGNTYYALHRPLYWYQRHLNRSYFNAGVMVVNTRWLQEKAIEKGFTSICECYEANEYKWSMADQDCLNYLAPNQVQLPRSLNAMPELSIWFLEDFVDSEKLTESIRNSNVLHWVGKMKPWSSARHGSHIDPDRLMMPMDLYLEACDEIKGALEPQFYRTVKINTTMWKSMKNTRC
ncbi:hypothetical protein M2H13_18755 [Vibrio vulnificus]|nr:hypothetical protein [Vibrio vulnificus]EJA3293419.1 hypothetical protein [Vibrio vulnificus]EJA3297113.1 hypothetical protein [Vibrio vulnificus]MCU8163192.1 hypothetical protein [Vibrio vulnificus]